MSTASEVAELVDDYFCASPTAKTKVKRWRNVDRIAGRPCRPVVSVDVRLDDSGLTTCRNSRHTQLKILASQIECRLNDVKIESAVVCTCSVQRC